MKKLLVLALLFLLTGCDSLINRNTNISELQDLNATYFIHFTVVGHVYSDDMEGFVNACYVEDDKYGCSTNLGDLNDDSELVFLSQLEEQFPSIYFLYFPFLELDVKDLDELADNLYSLSGDKLNDLISHYSTDNVLSYNQTDINPTEVECFMSFLFYEGRLTHYGFSAGEDLLFYGDIQYPDDSK